MSAPEKITEAVSAIIGAWFVLAVVAGAAWAYLRNRAKRTR